MKHLLPLRPITLCLFLFALSACTTGGRTPGVVIDDTVLETLVEREIRASDANFKGSHLVVVSYNGLVLLAGQVASEELRTKASQVTQGLNRVKRVHNELTVGGPTSFFARSNDGWLTSKVKSRLIAADDVNGTRIKVQTENGTVFLMGLVSRAEADRATEVARNVYGVQKIVKVFEYQGE
ncbi:MAG: BON domain-containing protein [Pseudomonadota bacterium]